MIKAVDLRKGTAVMHEGEIWKVHECQHVAKGNKRSYMQAKLKNLSSGQLVEQRFRVDDTLEVPFLDKKEMEYLYSAGADEHVLMDTESYEQIHVGSDAIDGDQILYLKPNERVTVLMHQGNIIQIDLPNTVDLEVTDTPPEIKGATATNQYKDATLETGLSVRVPPFISNGEQIRVDTRSGEFVERVK
jgi:elongation factor P